MVKCSSDNDILDKVVQGQQLGIILPHKNNPINYEMQMDVIDMIDNGILKLHLLKIDKMEDMPKGGELFYLACGHVDIWYSHRTWTCGYVQIYGKDYCKNCLSQIEKFTTKVIGYIGTA